jgi:HAD superfamily hydrolase (TIGR01662 family)
MTPKRFIDNFAVLLLDMGNTFMFEGDRFGPNEDYFGTYRNLGGCRLSADSVLDVIGKLFDHMLAAYEAPENYETFGAAGHYLRTMPVSASLPTSELMLLERVVAEHEIGRIPPSHVDALKELRRSHRLGVISNVFSEPEVFEREFARVGISDLFDVVVWSSAHGCIKPSPRLFRMALKQMNVDAGRAVYVGDSWKRDVVGAQAVGIKTVWIVNRDWPIPANGPHPDLIISDLRELLTATIGTGPT